MRVLRFDEESVEQKQVNYQKTKSAENTSNDRISNDSIEPGILMAQMNTIKRMQPSSLVLYSHLFNYLYK